MTIGSGRHGWDHIVLRDRGPSSIGWVTHCPVRRKMVLPQREWVRSGSILAHAQTLVRVLRRFADHDWPWHSRLVRAVGDHPPIDLNHIDMPVTYLAGKWDSITSAKRMREASTQTPNSRYVELGATHFVPLQFPNRMSTELRSLVDRCQL